MAKADSCLELRSASVYLITEAPPHLERHFRKLHGSSQKILQVLPLCYWKGAGVRGQDLYVSGTILAFHWCSFPGVFQSAYCQAVAVEGFWWIALTKMKWFPFVAVSN